jgi:muramidase (phage lysozyme)
MTSAWKYFLPNRRGGYMFARSKSLLVYAMIALSVIVIPVTGTFVSVSANAVSASCRGTTEILNLIGNTEGTDRGRGYNESLAYGSFTNGPVDLVTMSLDEIDILQTRMLNHPKNSMNSSALGRYQILRTTLRSLRRELGLEGDELFDVEMQDRLGIALLDRRGYSQWKAGRMSDRTFQANLSLEWASLTNPITGRGSYLGQNAGTKLSLQQEALDRAKCVSQK